MSTFPELLFARAAEHPRATAVQEKRYGVWQPLSWAQYARRVRELAHGLAAWALAAATWSLCLVTTARSG